MSDYTDEGQRIQEDVSENSNFADLEDWLHEPASQRKPALVPGMDGWNAFFDGLFETSERSTPDQRNKVRRKKVFLYTEDGGQFGNIIVYLIDKLTLAHQILHALCRVNAG